jgi:hypothetical protein
LYTEANDVLPKPPRRLTRSEAIEFLKIDVRPISPEEIRRAKESLRNADQIRDKKP